MCHDVEVKLAGDMEQITDPVEASADLALTHVWLSGSVTIVPCVFPSGKLLYVQYVYSPVVRMVTFRNGFVALSLQGSVIQEAFRCPDHINPDHNPLRNIKAQYWVTSRERDRDSQQTCVCDLQDFNPAQINLNFVSMLRTKPSSACILL
ncbi:hypothetical protein XENOCAPTIV_026775 [Xenoophorus captivus]|uniref:Uncharacterized protein n=1 Tax=Xenoophorus captivus TaxID=1517983 RepID=A0ABV0RCD0_9TELE